MENNIDYDNINYSTMNELSHNSEKFNTQLNKILTRIHKDLTNT